MKARVMTNLELFNYDLNLEIPYDSIEEVLPSLNNKLISEQKEKEKIIYLNKKFRIKYRFAQSQLNKKAQIDKIEERYRELKREI